MNINGTNKHDELIGTAGSDTISGLRGRDWIEGGKGDDFLIGDANAKDHERDTFVFRWGDGHDTIVDFESSNDAYSDKILIDSSHAGHPGQYSDVFGFFDVADGASYTNGAGTTLSFQYLDVNNDGVLDTRVFVSDESGTIGNIIDVLSNTSLVNADFMGG